MFPFLCTVLSSKSHFGESAWPIIEVVLVTGAGASGADGVMFDSLTEKVMVTVSGSSRDLMTLGTYLG